MQQAHKVLEMLDDVRWQDDSFQVVFKNGSGRRASGALGIWSRIVSRDLRFGEILGCLHVRWW